MFSVNSTSVTSLIALSLIGSSSVQCGPTVAAQCFIDIYVGTDFDRLFVERVIAHFEPTHGGTAGAAAYSISFFWDKFAGATSVEVVPSCACDKLSEWIVYSDAHIVPIGNTNCSGLKRTTSSLARITAVYNDTDLNVFYDRVKAEWTENPGRPYIVSLANLNGTREYSMVYMNEDGKIEEDVCWTDPTTVSALDAALPATGGSGSGKSFQLDLVMLPDMAWSSDCVGERSFVAGNGDGGRTVQRVSFTYRVSPLLPSLAPQRTQSLDSAVGVQLDHGKALLTLSLRTIKNVDIRLALVVGLAASAIYAVVCLRRSRRIIRESTMNANECKRLEKKLQVTEAARQRLAVEKDQLNVKLGHAERAFTEFSDRQQGLKESLEAESKKRDRIRLAREQELVEVRALFSESKTMLDSLSKEHGELLETFDRQRDSLSRANQRIEALVKDRQETLSKAQSENDVLKRDRDQLRTTVESMASQNRQLHGELDAERAKGVELSEQIRVLQHADPVDNGTSNDIGLEDFVNGVYATLFSSPQGYEDIGQLLRDLDEDAAIDGDAMAGRFGYQNLEAFIRSPALASRFVVKTNAEGGAVYKARPNETNMHLHEEQQIGYEYAINRRIKRDVNKAVERLRMENDKLRSQLALQTKDNVGRIKAELPKINSMQPHSRLLGSTPNEDQLTTSVALLTQATHLDAAHANGDHLPGPTILCSICFERPHGAVATIYKCGHCYCYQCIDGWRNPKVQLEQWEMKLRKLCPSCRKPIDDIIRIYGE